MRPSWSKAQPRFFQGRWKLFRCYWNPEQRCNFEAKPQGKTLQLNIGFCHPVDMVPPAAVEFAVEGAIITITGPDRQAVGQFAAEIRAKRPPEPYNGKGIRYVGEYVIRKQGKVFGS